MSGSFQTIRRKYTHPPIGARQFLVQGSTESEIFYPDADEFVQMSTELGFFVVVYFGATNREALLFLNLIPKFHVAIL